MSGLDLNQLRQLAQRSWAMPFSYGEARQLAALADQAAAGLEAARADAAALAELLDIARLFDAQQDRGWSEAEIRAVNAALAAHDALVSAERENTE